VALAKLLESYDEPAATARTDAAGRFRYDDVAPGIWLIGPPPAERRRARGSDREVLIAPAQPLQVRLDSTAPEIVIRLGRGLFVSGTVLDPDGQPVGGNSVFAQMQDSWVFENDMTDDSGRFSIGPLPAGRYSLTTGGIFGRYAPSEPVVAQAGEEDILLRVRAGGTIRGKVTDASGRARASDLLLAPDGDARSWIGTTTKDDGSFELEGLLPGSYSLTAVASGDLCGRRSGLRASPGETLDGIVVRLEAGARLKLRYTGGEPYGNFTLMLGGEVIGGDGIERGGSSLRVVPAGEIEVRWSDEPRDPEPFVQRITLGAGQERELVWDGKPTGQ
jgi:hypothetical protein